MLTVAERLEADYISGLEYATLEGEQKGMQLGKQEGAENIVKLIKEGYSLEEALEKVLSGN